MKKFSPRQALALSLSLLMLFALTACGGKDAGGNGGAEGDISSDPSERGTVTVTIGRRTTANPKFPSGDNYEDNAYTRMAEAELNIDIVDEFEAESGEDYNRQVSLALSAGTLPAMMKVSSKDELTELYENELIADLTQAYDAYASDYVKHLQFF